MELHHLNTQQIFFTCSLVFIFSFLITYVTRSLAINKNILDIPNERSSHHNPTPRGGGISIVLTFIGAMVWLGLSKIIPANLIYALVGGGIIVAIIGQCDDVYNMSARIRIIMHFSAAIWAVYWIGGFSILDLGTWKIILHHKGLLLAVIGIVWCINLYNFMDGIDGLAGCEGLFVAIACGVALLLNQQINLSFVMWLFAAAIAGFTFWNWPPAKIFLGDVGSGFLGYVFSVLAIYSANTYSLPINFWLILLAVFLCDATFTVINRALHGKPWYSAHREHAYQQLILNGYTHRFTTLSIVMLNTCILLPLAFASLHWPLKSFWIMSITIIGLFVVWVMIKFRKTHETNFTITEIRQN